MNLRPLGNNIMFTFLEDTVGAKGAFVDRHNMFVLPTSTNRQKVHRWGKVVAVGPSVDGVVPGDYILIEALMWMEGVKFEGGKIWKTDDSKVLAVTNDLDACQLQGI